MPPATFPALPSTTTCTVEFASLDTRVFETLRSNEWREYLCVRADNSWITARPDLVRSTHPRPPLAAVTGIGNARAINRRTQELS
jgi:hypothetical protein